MKLTCLIKLALEFRIYWRFSIILFYFSYFSSKFKFFQSSLLQDDTDLDDVDDLFSLFLPWITNGEMPLLCLCLVRFKNKPDPYTSPDKSPMSAAGVPTLAEISFLSCSFFVVSGLHFLQSPSRMLSELSSSSSIYSNSFIKFRFIVVESKIPMFDAESFALGGE